MRSSNGFALVLTILIGCGDNSNHSNVDAPMVDAAPDVCVPSLALQAITNGDLAMDDTQREVFLDMAPPLDRSILFFSIRHKESSPRYGAILCELLPADANVPRPAGLSCRHESMGSENTPATPVNIHWSVVTFTSGVKVQRGTIDTSVTNPNNATLSPAVDPSASFVVLGGTLSGGSGWGNNDFTRIELKNGTTLEIKQNAAGSVVPYQVVTMDGAQVVRGATSLGTNELTKQVTLTNVRPGSFVLATYTTDNPSSIVASAMMLQAGLTDSTLSFKRAMGGAAMEVAYEVVSLAYGARQFTTDFAAGETMKSQAVSGATATNSAAFSTNQAVMGHSSGSTSFSDAVVLDNLGEGVATLTVGAGSVAVQRTSSTAAASITWNAIDFSNNGCN